MSVIDVHLHVQPHDEFNAESLAFITSGRRDLDRYAEIERSPDALLRFLDEQEIEAACLINYVAPDTLGLSENVNAWVARYCRDHRDRLIAVGSVHPRFSKDGYGDARRLFDAGIRMVKLHPPHQLFAANAYLEGNEALTGIYRAAEDARVPVMIHTGTSVFPSARNRFADPMPIDDVAVDFPKLPIVLAHSGRPLFGDTAFFLARRHPNVFLELSGIPPKKLVEYLPRVEEVAGKTLWGTDWPSPGIRTPAENVAAFRALSLSEDAKRRILSDNARALFA